MAIKTFDLEKPNLIYNFGVKLPEIMINIDENHSAPDNIQD